MGVKLCRYPNGKNKAVTLSYDDGQIHDRRLISILNKYGLKGTFNLNSSTIGKDGFITSEEIVDLYNGHEVAIHTKSHPTIAYVPQESLIDEIMEDRKKIEDYSNTVINGLAYPNGSVNDKVAVTLKELGIVYGRTTKSTGEFNLPDDFMLWHPTYHHTRGIKKWSKGLIPDHDILLNKAKEFVEYPDFFGNMPLLYIWGHSYEFENDDTWDVIENFCEFISNFDNIWFATNIEIYNYMQALKRLRFSADLKRVYNPSDISVWVESSGCAVEIKSGETRTLAN